MVYYDSHIIARTCKQTTGLVNLQVCIEKKFMRKLIPFMFGFIVAVTLLISLTAIGQRNSSQLVIKTREQIPLSINIEIPISNSETISTHLSLTLTLDSLITISDVEPISSTFEIAAEIDPQSINPDNAVASVEFGDKTASDFELLTPTPAPTSVLSTSVTSVSTVSPTANLRVNSRTGLGAKSIATQPATVNQNANLRSGPGTNFAVVGQVQAGDGVEIMAQNADGTWYQLIDGEWIGAFLITSTSNGSLESQVPGKGISITDVRVCSNPQIIVEAADFSTSGLTEKNVETKMGEMIVVELTLVTSLDEIVLEEIALEDSRGRNHDLAQFRLGNDKFFAWDIEHLTLPETFNAKVLFNQDKPQSPMQLENGIIMGREYHFTTPPGDELRLSFVFDLPLGAEQSQLKIKGLPLIPVQINC
ncbi:MAG: SH3 domain-containing protein [Chloroflexota bacterium]